MAATRRRSRGQGMVEFALVVPFFLMLVFGTIELGRLMWINHTLANATREGARFAMVHGAESASPATQATVAAVVNDMATGVDGTISVSATNLGGEVGSSVSVTSSHQFSFFTAELLGLGPITLNHTSTVIIQH